MNASAIDINAALRDPAGVFSTPEDVTNHPGLTQEQKVEILRQWAYDASEAEVATDEGMPGGNNGLLQRILLALESMHADIGSGATAPTKQHALLRRRSKQ